MKNENHGFGKLARHNPHKCLQSHVGEVWEQKELILAWLVYSKVLDFGVLVGSVTGWCVGLKTKIMVLENRLDSILTNASKVMWEVWEQKELILAWLVHNQVHDFGVLA